MFPIFCVDADLGIVAILEVIASYGVSAAILSSIIAVPDVPDMLVPDVVVLVHTSVNSLIVLLVLGTVDAVPNAAPDDVSDAVPDAFCEVAVVNDVSIVLFLKVSFNLVLNDAVPDAVPDAVVLIDASDILLMLMLPKTESSSE